MQVDIKSFGADRHYATIKTDQREHNVWLIDAKKPADSLEHYAAEMFRRAEDMRRRALFALDGADHLRGKPRGYTFDRDLSFPGFTLKIDTMAGYGYFERDTGGEGGLQFENRELIDYDGAYFLPTPVGLALRRAGYKVGDECFNDPPKEAA
ncbi:MAG: hypothetical protein HY856_13475 [Burkholderiales bacterium]|nr:hypothetical protein [Burkholderiales bacterium]